jgi:hypothetical protein
MENTFIKLTLTSCLIKVKLGSKNLWGIPHQKFFFNFLWTKLIWSIDFVITKKKNFYWFSGRIRTFYRRKTGFYEKKSPSLCRLPWIHCCPNENFVRPIFERSFQVRHFSFWITEGIGLTRVIFVFLTSVTNSVG